MKQARKKIVSEKISAISIKKLAMNGGVKPKSEKLTCLFLHALCRLLNKQETNRDSIGIQNDTWQTMEAKKE